MDKMQQLFFIQKRIDRITTDLNHFDKWADYYLENNPDGAEYVDERYNQLLKELDDAKKELEGLA